MDRSNTLAPEANARDWLQQLYAERMRVVCEQQDRSREERTRQAVQRAIAKRTAPRPGLHPAGVLNAPPRDGAHHDEAAAAVVAEETAQMLALDGQHRRELERLDALLQTPAGQGRTGAQLAHASLDPLTEKRPQQQQRTPTKEFNRQGDVPPGDVGYIKRAELADAATRDNLADVSRRPLSDDPKVLQAWDVRRQQFLLQQQAQERAQRLADGQTKGRSRRRE